MSIVRSLESINRRFWYALLRRAYRNRDVAPPIDASSVRNILILRHDAIGDMVVTTAAIDLIKRRIPAAQIDVIASKRNVDVLRNDDRVRGVHLYGGGLGAIRSLAKMLKRNRYDVVFAFVFSKTTEAGLLANAIGGPRAIKVAVRNDDRAHLYRTFFNMQIAAPRFTRTMAQILCGVVADAFGWTIGDADVRMSLRLSDAHRERARAFHDAHSERLRASDDAQVHTQFIVVNISAGDYRRWSFAKYEAFVRAILDRHPELHVVVVSMPDDHDEACRLIPLDSVRVAVAPASKDILDVAAVLEGATIVMSPDTSIVHIASAVGAPALTLYSQLGSHYTEWMPFGVPYEAVVTRGAVPVETLSVDEVFDAFERLYARVGPSTNETRGRTTSRSSDEQ